VIYSTVCFIASNAFDFEYEISLLDDNSCPGFEQWSAIRESDSKLDFRPIQRLGSALHGLFDCVVDLSRFE
jgi:hypothetical protein